MKTRIRCERCKTCFTFIGIRNADTKIRTLVSIACKCHKEEIEFSFHEDWRREEKERAIQKYVEEELFLKEIELWHGEEKNGN